MSEPTPAELRQSLERCRRLAEHFVTAFRYAPVGMAILDAAGRLAEVNPALCDMLGTSAADCTGASMDRFVHPADLPAAAAAFRRLVQAHLAANNQELRVVRPDGMTRWALASTSPSGESDSYILQLVDITARKDAEQRLVHQALHDALTGLPNRVLFLDRLGQALTALTRDPGMVAVLFLDLDGFKSVNDTLGHARGDDLLKEIGSRLRHTVRASDTLARFGGDEFALLVHDLGAASQAVELAERVVAAIRPPVRIDEHERSVTASIGIAVTSGSQDAGELLRRADVAMYQAKADLAGWVVYRDEPGQRGQPGRNP